MSFAVNTEILAPAFCYKEEEKKINFTGYKTKIVKTKIHRVAGILFFCFKFLLVRQGAPLTVISNSFINKNPGTNPTMNTS